MTTGWKIIDSEGEVYKSILYAAKALKDNPTLTFESSEFDMAGIYKKDITDQVHGAMIKYINNAR
jgi:hypothetical protein